MKKTCNLKWILMIGFLFTLGTPVFAAVSWENINGKVTYNGMPIRAMVLANGQHMFTSMGDGSFNMDVPLDKDGRITIFAFCSGLAPYKQVIGPEQGTGLQISMASGEQGVRMVINCTLEAISETRVVLRGNVTYNGTPVCAIVLANGQHAFTCNETGSFSLNVPLDGMGSITFFGFCDGLPPYKKVYTTDQINFNNDIDGDGFSVAEGDCDDLNPNINPWEEEICGDGIDQNCDGRDLACSGETTSYIAYANINLDSNPYEWDNLRPIHLDPAGDCDDAGVDILRVYAVHDDTYLYVRVVIQGLVDSSNQGNFFATATFEDASLGRSLMLDAPLFLREVQITQLDNKNPSFCIMSHVLMCYPSNNYLSWSDHSITYRIRLSDLDWNLNRTRMTVSISKDGYIDQTIPKIVRISEEYLNDVQTDWPDEQIVENKNVPFANISIDGDFSDWQSVPPLSVDQTDDVFGVPATNIEKVFIAQDNTSFFFRFDLLSAPHYPGYFGDQCRFEFKNKYTDQQYWVTAWLFADQVEIQDVNAFDVRVPNSGTVYKYTGSSYIVQNERFIEYKILKSDFPHQLENFCVSTVSIIGGASDYTFSVNIIE